VKRYDPETLAVTDPEGRSRGEGSGDVVPPLHLSTAFEMNGGGDGYKYSRMGNPTRRRT